MIYKNKDVVYHRRSMASCEKSVDKTASNSPDGYDGVEVMEPTDAATGAGGWESSDVGIGDRGTESSDAARESRDTDAGDRGREPDDADAPAESLTCAVPLLLVLLTPPVPELIFILPAVTTAG